MLSDEELRQLMRAAQQGDNNAYRQLLTTILPAIKGYVYKQVGAGNDNEDIIQNILLAIHQNGASFNTDRSFTAWMFAIAHYKVNDYLRIYYKTIQHVSLDEWLEKGGEISNVTKAPHSNEYKLDQLSGISELQKTILLKMKIEGKTAKETAKELSMSESAVKVSAHRAYQKLKTLLQR